MEPFETLGVARDASEKEIEKAYRELAKKHHPDKTGKAESKEFREIKEARDAMVSELKDKKERKNLPAVKQSAAFESRIVNAIREAMTEKKGDFEARRQRFINSEKRRVKDSLRIPRVALAAISAVFTFIFLFPGLLESSPVYPLVSDATGRMILTIFWVISLILTAEFYILTWIDEKVQADRIRRMTETESLKELLDGMKAEFKGTRFTKKSATKLIYRIESRQGLARKASTVFLLIRDTDFFERITRVILDEFVSKGLIVRLEAKDLDEWYAIVH